MGAIQTRLIIGSDSLLQPVTGIGYYTKNLIRSLISEGLVDDLLLFANGVFLDEYNAGMAKNEDVVGTASEFSSRSNRFVGPMSLIRNVLSKSQAALYIYEHLMPLIEKKRLSPYKGYIFHSPNYLLPKFDGLKVVTFHDLSIQLYPEFHPSQRVRLLEKQMARSAQNADHIITDSECVKGQIKEFYGISESKISAIPLAAGRNFRAWPDSYCQPVLEKYGLKPRRFFLFVGTVEPRKNIRRICLAYKILRARGGVDWPIVFVGARGWKSQAEHEDIRELVSKGWALYLGYSEEKILSALYSSASALVFPSIYEGFGLPAVEAQKSGTRVITSANTSMAEFASGYDILVNPYEVEDIAFAMRKIILDGAEGIFSNPPESRSFLSWEKTALQTSKVYRELENPSLVL